MNELYEILKLSSEKIEELIKKGENCDTYYSALVIKKFMEKYHIKNQDAVINEFTIFKKNQSKLLDLSEEEEKFLFDFLETIRNTDNSTKEDGK